MFAASNTPAHSSLKAAMCRALTGMDVAALCFAIDEAPSAADADASAQWRKLIPAPDADGIVRGIDGRWWRLSNPQGVIDRFKALKRPLAIDINHSTEIKAPEGEASPAQGWVEDMEVRDGAVWGHIEWNSGGQAILQNKDYRFLSPVLIFDKNSKEIAFIKSVGFTNWPNFDLALNSATTPETNVDEAIREALGLSENATAEQAVNAINKLNTQLTTARNAAQSPSLDQFVPRGDYDTALNRAQTAESKLKEHEQTAHKEKVDTAINAALKAGKITPATREYHTAQCMAEGGLERFQQFVEAAPVVADTSNLDGKKPGQGTETALNAAEKKVASLFGNSAEDIAKFGKETA